MIPSVGRYKNSGHDPFFSSVALLLHFDGTNGQTTTTDSSGSPHTVTLTNAALSSTQAKFGATSLHVTPATSGNANVTGVVSPPDNLQLGANAWTLEFWIYPTSVSSSYAFNMNTTNTNSPITIIYNGSGFLSFQYTSSTPGTNSFLSDAALPLNAWSFVQFRRTNNPVGSDVFAAAINGTAQTNSASESHGLTLFQTNAVQVGGTGGVALPAPAYIDELRLTNGVARPFNLPTAAFSNF